MPWMLWTRDASRKTRGKRAFLLVALAALSAAAGGCASPFTTPSTAVALPTPALYFVLDGNFVAAKSTNDLRYTVVALDTRNGHVAWQHTLEASSPADATGARYQPVYRDGVVYVGYYYEHAADPQNPVRHGVVEALEAATGTVRWQRALDDTPSMAASADGRVFVTISHVSAGVCCTGHLFALDASDGLVAWDYTSDAPLTRGGDVDNARSNAPLVVGGRVYALAVVRDADGAATLKLLALNAGDGSVAWQHQAEGITATPAFNQSGETVCVSSYDTAQDASTILGLAASSGATRWRITGMLGIVSGCAAGGDTFYVTQRSPDKAAGSVIALRGQDGRQLWKVSTDPPIAADGLLAPAAGTGVVGVYLQGPAATPGPLMSTMAVLRASDGSLLWRHDFGGRPGQVLDIEGDLIFNPERSGDLPVVIAYALETGAVRWTYTLGRL